MKQADDYRVMKALDIVRRFVDKNAQLDRETGVIKYATFTGKKELRQVFSSDQKPVLTRSGRSIFSPQFVKVKCALQLDAAIKMAEELAEDVA